MPADGNGFVDAALVDAAAGVVRELAETTPRGEGNFNFTVNFACPPLIPYFPAGYATREGAGGGESFAIGLEFSDLLAAVLAPMGLGAVEPADRSRAWVAAGDAARDAIEARTKPLAAAARRAAAAFGVAFAGLDSSAAPSKDRASLCTRSRPSACPALARAGPSRRALSSRGSSKVCAASRSSAFPD